MFYKGKGEHSVNELEQIIGEQKEKLETGFYLSLTLDGLLTNKLISVDQYKKACEFYKVVYNEELI